MKIINLKVMRGPNYWSKNSNKLIVLKLDLEESVNFPTNLIDGFAENLEQLMPSLHQNIISFGKEKNFLESVRKGISVAFVVEQLAIELQKLAGMESGLGFTRSAFETGTYHVVFSYEIEKAGIYAAKAAINIVEHISSDMSYDLNKDLKELQTIYSREKLGPSTLSIVKEAEKRNIPWTRMNNDSLLMLGQGCNQKIICASVACTTSSIAVDLSSDKESTRQILSNQYIPVPKGLVVETESELISAITKLGFPLVAKPINGNHGRGITTRINSEEHALKAFNLANLISKEVIIEKFIEGDDYRFLVIDFKLIAVAKRRPAMIMGDNNGSTIQQLIDETNNDERRGIGHEKVLTKIKIDENTQSILIEKNLSLNSVLPTGEILFLKDTANLSTGGTSRDVTDIVHPHNIFLAERIARLMNLDICGIDIISKDINIPITENNGVVIEVNSGPGFRMHLSPSNGLARNVADPVMSMLFKENALSRIPLVAVTGTNGKTTITRLIAHIAKTVGHNVGYITTDGIYINDNEISEGDCSGPSSAAIVLRDSLVDFAVLECARGGILRSGLGFDKCNVSIVTNITEDHLGLNDIHTLDELANVKAVVANSTFDEGYAILNADDERVYKMKDNLKCNIALFSLNSENIYIKEHCKKGGIAAIIEKNNFVLCKGEYKTIIANVGEFPLTFNGNAECMIKNILPAILAAVVSHFSIEQIKNALKSFHPSPETTPGRMNVFKFKNFRVMLDYAHNNDGYVNLNKFVSQEKATHKVGIIAGTGDRRDEDIKILGTYAAQMFDELIIRHDKDGRGRTNEEISNLLLLSIKATKPSIPVQIISDEQEAIKYAIDNAIEDSLIIVCTDMIRTSIKLIRNLQNLEQSKQVVQFSNI